jgi:hypothetical protein
MKLCLLSIRLILFWLIWIQNFQEFIKDKKIKNNMNNITTKTNIDTEFNKYQEISSRVRLERRELWEKIILLSSAILGFSVTMFSKDFSAIIYLPILKIGWGLFFVNILCGLLLLKKESDFELQQAIANVARKWDEEEMNIPVKTQEDKDKFITLTYLHSLRTIPSNELPFSKWARDIFEVNKGNLTSWKMIKNPEKFYSYSHLQLINRATTIFYGSFALAILSMILSVVL